MVDRKTGWPLTVWYLITLLLSCQTPPTDEPSVVLHHGKIVTLDPDFQIVQAVAIDGERILAVGANDDILALAGRETTLVDLEGQTVVPGFADNHYHSIGGGPGVDLSSARTLDDVL